MPIQSDDIKLLRSAVMADVPEGGGAATGIEVVDGQSNNIFDDVSADDRAAGRVSILKVFGAAHTDDQAKLLGAHFAMLAPPADPLVHVAIFETPGWADERATAKDHVERYMVKGPRLSSRIMETHYAGSRLLQLYQVGGSSFPAAGDSVCLRNPDGAEQFVRVQKVTVGTGTYYATEGGSTTSFLANVAVCELAQALAFDVPGPPIARAVSEGNTYAIAYSTSVAVGAEFHGVKPLAAPADVGDRSVILEGGIYLPLVPAATVEQPLLDLAPLVRRQSLSRTGVATLTLPAKTMALQPGTALRLPTAAQPGTVSVVSGTTAFTDDGKGNLKQGTLTVAGIDYRGRVITFLPASPSYASASVVVSCMPATPAGAATHSHSLLITTANQGLAFTAAFEPPPAPGTMTVSYMAQGRWYDLVDNGNGQLAGVDSSYGSGSINYQSGSVAYTLGAIPDVGSRILYAWGDAAQAEAVAPADRPARLQAVAQLSGALITDTLELDWTAAGQPKSASCSATGQISGDATGSCLGGLLTFVPDTVPDAGSLVASYDQTPLTQTGATDLGGGNWRATVLPVEPGTLRFAVPTVLKPGFDVPGVISVVDSGMGTLISTTPGVIGSVGTVNYATGDIAISAYTTANLYERVVKEVPLGGGQSYYYEDRQLRTSQVLDLQATAASGFAYSAGAVTAGSESPALAWQIAVPVLSGMSFAVDSLAFAVGGQLYSALGGVLSRGWDIALGATAVAGAVSDSGQISVTSLPSAGQNTAITWHNVAQARAAGKVSQGVFRVETAPIKVGVFQIQAGGLVGNANNSGVITGDGWTGTVDFDRGIVTWSRATQSSGPYPWNNWTSSSPVAADELTYNAVFLQYVPLDESLLGLSTARLPLDGKVPGYRKGGQVIVHNTLTTTLPSNPTRDQAYSLGRQRVASVVLRSASGVRVPGDRFVVDYDAGTVTIPAAANLVGIDQPMTAHHRIEDTLLVTEADISGQLKLVSGLTHNYPAGTSYVSSKLRCGDLFARSHGYIEQAAWTNVWSDDLIGSQPVASFNDIDFPVEVTNRGAITERWAVIFTSATQVRVVGENVGQVLTGVSITGAIEPLNPQTGAPYFSIDALGWGGGWAVGNVLRFNTAACGAPVWVARTVLPGPATQQSDSAVLMFGGDVDA